MFSPREARLRLGLNQTQMAAAIGVHRNLWLKWERGERPPTAAPQRLIETLLWLNDISMLDDYLSNFKS